MRTPALWLAARPGDVGWLPSVESVNRRVARWGAMWGAFALGLDERVYDVLVSGAVKSVRPLGHGDWRVLMTSPWTPKAENGRPLRLVVLIDERDYANPDDGFQREEMDAIPRAAWLHPTMRITYRDGHTRVARDPHQAK